jgi:hexosaminidase
MLLVALPAAASPRLATAAGAVSSQERLDELADGLRLTYRVLTNVPGPHCGGAGSCYSAEIALESPHDFGFGGWQIYFSAIKAVRSTSSREFSIEHLVGDLHRLEPTAEFTGFVSGVPQVIPLVGDGWQVSEFDPMPNYYVVADGLEPRVIASTRPGVADTGLEFLPFVEPFSRLEQFRGHPQDENVWATAPVLFDRNGDVASLEDAVATAIIPTPAEVVVARPGARLDLAPGIAVDAAGVGRSDLAAALARLDALGVRERGDGVPLTLRLETGPDPVPESYSLTVGEARIDVAAADAAGASHALHSLASLLRLDRGEVPQMVVRDRPRFAFRGLHMDLARNFQGKDLVLQVLDQMAAYKLNVLHLHLADDEGWRIEIPGLPELTEVGSRRCHDLSERRCLLPQLGSGPDASAPGNGYLTRADYVEIVAAARDRHVRVIPSVDMPGHSRAAIKAMEERHRRLEAAGQREEAERYLLSDPEDRTEYESIQYYTDNTINVCMDSSYRFIGKVVDEMSEMHAEAGQPLTRYHVGADETAGAWYDSPRCREFLTGHDEVAGSGELGGYFIERVAALLGERGIGIAAWSDGLSDTRLADLSGLVQSNVWGTLGGGAHEAAHAHANRGWRVVLSTPDVTFLDFPYQADPKESGYYWGSRQTNTRKIFNFMPENLPANAETVSNAFNQPIVMDDTPASDHRPLAPSVRFEGMQAQLWSELVRRPVTAQAMLFPRLLAIAERAWHRGEWEVPYRHEGARYDRDSGSFTTGMRALRDREWQAFANALGHKELVKLDRLGVHYRVPTVGARRARGRLEANVIFPGLPIEYRAGGGSWQPYSGPVEVSGEVAVRARSADGSRVGRSLVVAAPGED